jgi:hypothetical protein
MCGRSTLDKLIIYGSKILSRLDIYTVQQQQQPKGAILSEKIEEQQKERTTLKLYNAQSHRCLKMEISFSPKTDFPGY